MLATLCSAPDSRRTQIRSECGLNIACLHCIPARAAKSLRSGCRWACSVASSGSTACSIGLTSCPQYRFSCTGNKDSACDVCSWCQADQAVQDVPEKHQLLPLVPSCRCSLDGSSLSHKIMYSGCFSNQYHWCCPTIVNGAATGYVHPASLKQVTPISL